MEKIPFLLQVDLDGWELFWAFLEVGEDTSGLPGLRHRVFKDVRRRFPEAAAVASHPPVTAMRKLFRAAGCDPTRYRPASEALLRRLVKGADLPAIHPLVDVNNCLSAVSAVPCCVMREGSFGSELLLRVGRAGESYESLRGPFNLESKPLLVDENGPLDAPITGSKQVMVQPGTTRAWLVAYLPSDEVSSGDVWEALEAISADAGVIARRF